MGTALDLLFDNMKSKISGLIFALILCVGPMGSRAFDGFTLMGPELKIDGQTNWYSYTGTDVIGGAYMGWIWEGKSNVLCSINLNRSLAPGDYRVFLRVVDYSS